MRYYTTPPLLWSQYSTQITFTCTCTGTSCALVCRAQVYHIIFMIVHNINRLCTYLQKIIWKLDWINNCTRVVLHWHASIILHSRDANFTNRLGCALTSAPLYTPWPSSMSPLTLSAYVHLPTVLVGNLPSARLQELAIVALVKSRFAPFFSLTHSAVTLSHFFNS